MPTLFEPIVLARAVHFAATIALCGMALFRCAVGWPAQRRLLLARLTIMALAAAFVSGVVWCALVARDAGATLNDLAQTQFGVTMLMRGGLIALIAAMSARFFEAPGSRGDLVLAALGCALAGGLALTGHAGASDYTHALADAVHLIAAGAWLGALAPLAIVLGIKGGASADVVRRFSTLGIASVGALILTGAINAFYLAGGLPGLAGTPWGRLLCLKLALFAAMLCLAAVNRLYLTPRLEGSAPELRRNAFIEAGCGLAVIAIVALLGATPPGAHTQPDWPFAWRFDGAVLYADPGQTGAAWRCLLSFGASVGLLIAATFWRRARRTTLAAGVALLALAASDAPSLTAPAYPTTFRTSPEPFSARTIAAGAGIFAAQCAWCHGPRGHGDGPAAAGLAGKPVDLTRDHLFAHRDGDLFWWISHGLGLMPGFAATLDEAARWRLIDFLHANADGVRLAALNGRVAGAAVPLPDFTLACAGTMMTSADLAGGALHIIVAGENSEGRLRQLSFLAPDSGVTTVVLRQNGAPRPESGSNMCEAEDAALADALAVYRAVAAEALDGAEFLVDAQGRLRSSWHANTASDWRDPLVFRRAIAELRTPPDLARALGAVNTAPGAGRIDYDTQGHRH